jgi:integrase
MTNPRVVLQRVLVDGKLKDVLDEEATRELRNREPLSNSEIDGMLEEADKIANEYFKLRAKAIIALAKKFGKRRSEIASLEVDDLKIENGKLYVTFTIRKKHKKGLFQYLKWLKKNRPESQDKPLIELQQEWQEWTKTEEGIRRKEERRTKAVSVSDKYSRHIVEYRHYLETYAPNSKYLFPSGVSVFGEHYKIRPNKHLTGRQVLGIIKPLNPTAWMHLFRETKGAEIAKTEGNRLLAVYQVRDTLDLEKEETAYRYVRRYAVQEMKAEK